MDTEFVMVDNLVAVKAGEPYRLLPFGPLVKGGIRREITPEFARRFKLPHFSPPIKLGSHKDETPAGGHILALEVRDDGLYAIPEYTEKGVRAVAEGDFRYHSPEIVFSDGAVFEDPTTGKPITGPLIIGDALLHTPHLGEAAALYTAEITEEPMTDEVVTVPKTFWETFSAWFKRATEQPEPAPELPAVEPEKFEVLQAERDDLAAKLQAYEAERAQAARIEKFTAALAETKAEPNAAMLAGMTDEQADWVLAQFAALSAQVNESALLGELGTTAAGDVNDDPKARLDVAVKSLMAEKKIDYSAAIGLVDPALLAAAYPVRK